MIKIDSAFDPTTNSIHSFYQQPGIGYYIPLYQREYSWDSDNIEQLLTDLSKGIENCLEDDDEIRFLGTIIAVQEGNTTLNISPQEPKALPSRIDKIIDGQQRLSTISVLATRIYHSLQILKKKLKKDEVGTNILEATKFWEKKLIDVFSLDLQRGTPEKKPKIIRGSVDQWTMDGEINDNYFSPVANYLGHFIAFATQDKALPKFEKNQLQANIRQIDNWLKNEVLQAHAQALTQIDFTPAWLIINAIDENFIWQYKRPELTALIDVNSGSDKKSINFLVCQFIQLFTVCHYLLDRCCFTVIKPSKDDWAFDLFQSLNATGTPLTAIETFAPLVNHTVDLNGGNYKASKTKVDFDNILSLFEDSKNAAQKSKITNDFITSLSLTTDGTKLSSHFSHQKKWLDKVFVTRPTFNEQKLLINFFGNYSKFYKSVWLNYQGDNGIPINEISTEKESNLASFLFLFLRDSNHKMAITILGRFYNDIIIGKPNSKQNFISALKAVSAFYFIWRSCKSNSGLDTVYREFLKGTTANGQNWCEIDSIELDKLKSHFREALKKREITDKSEFIKLSKVELTYGSPSLCRFALLTHFDDNIPDTSKPGILKKGALNCNPHLTVDKWNSTNVRTIEHVAPQKNSNNSWPLDLYDDVTDYVNSIGNLTLLPLSINSSASNKGWGEKLFYYKHLGQKDPSIQANLQAEAATNGITLEDTTINLLQSADYHEHMNVLTSLDINFVWDSKFVTDRTESILNDVYDKISIWLD